MANITLRREKRENGLSTERAFRVNENLNMERLCRGYVSGVFFACIVTVLDID